MIFLASNTLSRLPLRSDWGLVQRKPIIIIFKKETNDFIARFEEQYLPHVIHCAFFSDDEEDDDDDEEEADEDVPMMNMSDEEVRSENNCCNYYM